MTKNQANEPGFVLVPREPTEEMLVAANDLLHDHPHETSLNVYRAMLAAAPIVPAPAYGVKALEWTNIGRCVGWTAEDERTHLYHAQSLDRLYEVARGKVGWWAKWQGAFHAQGLPTLDEAKAACQADFERRILYCLSSAPVEEADAKAGETYYTKGKDADHFERLSDKDFAWALTCAAQDLNDSAENVSEWMPVTALLDGAAERIKAALTAPNIPSELEAKGEAGAGPVGEAVAWRVRAYPGHRWQIIETIPHNFPRDWEKEPLHVRPSNEPVEAGESAAFDEWWAGSGRKASYASVLYDQAAWVAWKERASRARPVEEPGEVEGSR